MTQTNHLSPTRGRPVDAEARLERASRILRAARACFLVNGFHGASIADIAKAAGVSIANIYQYFDSKDAMILALIEENAEHDRHLTSQLITAAFDPVRLRQQLEAYFTTSSGHEEARIRQEILSEASRNMTVASVVRQADDDSIYYIQQGLAANQRKGMLDAGVDTHEAAQVLGYLFEGLATRYAIDQSSGPRLMDLFIRIILQTLHLTNR